MAAITKLHAPSLWEGGCRICSAAYRRDAEMWLELACMPSRPLRTADWHLHRLFGNHHQLHESP